MRPLNAIGATAATVSVVAAITVSRRRRRRSEPGDPLATVVSRSWRLTTSDGASLGLMDAGEGPVVVLAHGWTESRMIWSATAAKLISSGHRVVLYDQRGHGESTIGSAGISIERLGEDLCEILTKLDLHDAVIVGHSMGGMTIMASMVEHPELISTRVQAALLVSTAAAGLGRHPRVDGLAGVLIGSAGLTRAFAGPLGPYLVRRSLGRRPDPGHSRRTATLFATTAGATRRDCWTAISTMDLRTRLGSASCPVTVVVGARDHLTPPRLAREIVGLIPGSGLVVLPDVGHQLPFEAPDSLAALIRGASATSPPTDHNADGLIQHTDGRGTSIAGRVGAGDGQSRH